MAILSTRPIENNPVSGVRPTQQVTIRLVNRAAVDSISVYIQGYVLSTIRTLYVSEVTSIAANEAVTRDYFADLDAFEFVFETSAEGVEEVEISVWGKQASTKKHKKARIAPRLLQNRESTEITPFW